MLMFTWKLHRAAEAILSVTYLISSLLSRTHGRTYLKKKISRSNLSPFLINPSYLTFPHVEVKNQL